MSGNLIVSNADENKLAMLANAEDDFAGMRARDHILPRATLLQALSPDVVDGRFPAGTVIDSATKMVLVEPRKDGKVIIPLMFWLEWIEWNRKRDVPKEEKVIARSVDPLSDLAKRAEKWETYTNNEGKEVCVVTEYFNFICMFVDPAAPDYDNVYLTGFSKSSHRIGKMWLNRMSKTKVNVNGEFIKPPMWAMQWAYKTELQKKDGNAYYVPSIGDGKVNPIEHWEYIKAVADGFKSRRAEIMDRNSARTEDTAHEAGAPTGAAGPSEM